MADYDEYDKHTIIKLISKLIEKLLLSYLKIKKIINNTKKNILIKLINKTN